MTFRLRSFWLAATVAAFVCILVYQSSDSAPPPALPAGELASLDVDLEATPPGQKALRTSTSDPANIEAVADVLRRGRSVGEHKCETTGRLTFRLRDGSSKVVGLLAGHDGRSYEYRADSGTFRVDRAALDHAMSALGVAHLHPGAHP
jgi:hypothetical protein